VKPRPRFRCMAKGCEDVQILESWAAAERHADSHGGGRLEQYALDRFDRFGGESDVEITGTFGVTADGVVTEVDGEPV
jgi:hypothetical protein